MTEEIPIANPRRPDPLSLLWRFFAAPQTVLGLLAGVVAVLGLSLIVPQIPTEARADVQTWLALQPGGLSQDGSAARLFHLFDLSHALWFRLLLGLTGVALAVRAVESAELAVQAGHGKYAACAPANWRPAASWISGLGVEQVRARLVADLEERGYSVSNPVSPDGVHLGVARRPALLWIYPAACAALLGALVCVVVDGLAGWQDPDWAPSPGEIRPVGRDGALRLRLDAYQPVSEDGGRPRGPHAQVTWLEGETAVRQADLRAGRPSVWHSRLVRLVGHQASVRVRGRDPAGRPLAVQAEGTDSGQADWVTLPFPSSGSQRILLVPSLGWVLALQVDGPEGSASLKVWVVEGSESTASMEKGVRPEGTLDLGAILLDFDVSHLPVLRLAFRPGLVPAVAGGALALLLLLVAWVGGPRAARIACRPVQEGKTAVALSVPSGPSRRSWQRRLAAGLRAALGDAA